MRVCFNKINATGEFPDLTDGKIYEVEDTIEMPDDYGEGTMQAYVLTEDDHDEQVPYDARIFEVVTSE